MEEIEREYAKAVEMEQEMAYLEGERRLLLNSLESMRKALETLTYLPEVKEGDEILLPLGGGIMIRTLKGDDDRVFRNIGAGYVVEEERRVAIEALEERIQRIEETVQRISIRLDDLKKAHAVIQRRLQEAYQREMNVQRSQGEIGEGEE